jgi:hypothetical protein
MHDSFVRPNSIARQRLRQHCLNRFSKFQRNTGGTMNPIMDGLFAAATAGLLTLIFSQIFRRVGPFNANWPFFVIVWLTAWAGGTWITPIGPDLWGVYWLPFFVAGTVVALLLAALGTPKAPDRRDQLAEAQRSPEPANAPTMDEDRARAAMLLASSYLWFALFGLILIILARYFLGR